MKVVWICHFSSNSIREKIKPLLPVPEFAPWITYTSKVFENQEEIELHIVSPYPNISGEVSFAKGGVHYHFFNSGLPILGFRWPNRVRLDYWTNFLHNKRVINEIVRKISPDVVHLQGAENPYYSSAIFQLIDKYPVVVNAQRIDMAFNFGTHWQNIMRANIEKSIFDQCSHFTVRTDTMETALAEYKPGAHIYQVNYAMPHYSPLVTTKCFDLVFFASVAKIKGIEDLFKAMALVKESISSLNACIIGSVSRAYKDDLTMQVRNLGLEDNVIWKGYLPSLNDVHCEASKARISVLPTYNDIISGTIIESMQLGLPVVSYRTGSIPELNVDRENVLLSERGDIDGLANSILRLLTDDELYKTMSQRGIECIEERYSNQNVLTQHLDCYKDVIADFHKDKR